LAIEVHALRRDGFDGEIPLECEGLPEGVRVDGAVIPAGHSLTTLVLRTESVAERWDGGFRVASGDVRAKAMRLRRAVQDFDREEVLYAGGAVRTNDSPPGITLPT
jgi:hypothetical protein